MKNRVKKPLSILLTLALILALLPALSAPAYAATRTVSTAAELEDVLKNKLSSGDIVKLSADINFPQMIDFIQNKNFTIDLNGRKLTVTSADRYGLVASNCELKLTGAGELNFIGYMAGARVDEKAKVTVTNSKATWASGVGATANGGELHVTGNVETTGASGIGARAIEGGKITIDGTITVPAGATYIQVGTQNKTKDQFTTTTTKAGYLTYTDGTSTVWVKDQGAGFTLQPVDRTVKAGDDVTFTVKTYGQVNRIRWYYLQKGTTNYYPGQYDKDTWSGNETDTLTIRNVPASLDGWKFMCQIRGDDGEWIRSAIVTLTVSGYAAFKPKIIDEPVSVRVAGGERAEFTVKVEALPLPTYQWQVLEAGESVWKDITGRSHSFGYFYQNTDRLVIMRVAQGDGADGDKFRCVVKNSEGSVISKEATLTIIGGFVAVTDIKDVPSKAVIGTRLRLEGTVDPADATNQLIDWTVKDDGGTGAEINPRGDWFTAKSEGVAVVTATIKSGTTTTTDFTKDFEIFVSEFVDDDKDESGMDNFKPVNTYKSGQFTDVNENDWWGYNREGVIATAFEYGLITGKTVATFDPRGNMKVTEAIALAARVHRIYTTGKDDIVMSSGSGWYLPYVEYAVENGIIMSSDFTDIDRPATRAEMAYIFSNSLPEEKFAAQNTVNSLPDVTSSTPYRESIIMLYEAGILTGNDSIGTFKPDSTIIRAEAAGIISRIILPDTRKSGLTY